jgi:hypothetical protein
VRSMVASGPARARAVCSARRAGALLDTRSRVRHLPRGVSPALTTTAPCHQSWAGLPIAEIAAIGLRASRSARQTPLAPPAATLAGRQVGRLTQRPCRGRRAAFRFETVGDERHALCCGRQEDAERDQAEQSAPHGCRPATAENRDLPESESMPRPYPTGPVPIPGPARRKRRRRVWAVRPPRRARRDRCGRGRRRCRRLSTASARPSGPWCASRAAPGSTARWSPNAGSRWPT